MATFDEPEYDRWLRVAGDEEEEAARTLLTTGITNSAVLHAEHAGLHVEAQMRNRLI